MVELPKIPDKSIDMILTDLPYGSTRLHWDKQLPIKPLFSEFRRIIKDNGVICLTAKQPLTSKLIIENLDIFRYTQIWEKNTATGIFSAKQQPLKYFEDIIVFYKTQPTYNPQFIKRTVQSQERCKYNVKNGGGGQHHPLERRLSKYDPTKKYPSDVIKINSEPNSRGKLHPTQKPVALLDYLIKTYTNEGDLILDCCVGSGTTCLASKQLNRNWIGIEKNPEYAEIARKRLEAVTQLTPS